MSPADDSACLLTKSSAPNALLCLGGATHSVGGTAEICGPSV